MASEEDTLDDKIFVRDSKPLTFYIIPCKRKRELTNLLEKHGGKMSNERLAAEYQLYIPGDIVSNPKMVSSKFIEDSIEAESLLDIEKYRYAVREKIEKKILADEEQACDTSFVFKEEPVIPRNNTRVTFRQREYTIREDMNILEAVLKQSKHHSINGMRLWDSLAAQQVTKRSSLSMKERFVKKILPFVENYNLSAVELKKLKSLSSAKTNQVRNKTGNAHRKASLPFLRAPKPVSRAHDKFELSSSSDDSLGSLVAPHNRITRKHKPILVELSSNSSQSGSSQQSQRQTKSSEANDGKSREKHTSTPSGQKRLRKERSPRSTAVSQTFCSGSSGAASYVIEESPPDVESPSTSAPPAKMDELAQFDDLDLLAPARKLRKRNTIAGAVSNAKLNQQSQVAVGSTSAAALIELLTDSSDCASALSPEMTSLNKSQKSPVRRITRQSTESPKAPSVERLSVTSKKRTTRQSTASPELLSTSSNGSPAKRTTRQSTGSPKTLSTKLSRSPSKKATKQSNDVDMHVQSNVTNYPETQPFTTNDTATFTQQFTVTEDLEEYAPFPNLSKPPLSAAKELRNVAKDERNAHVTQSPLLFVEHSPQVANDWLVEETEKVPGTSGSSAERGSESGPPATRLNDSCRGSNLASDNVARGEGHCASSILAEPPTNASTQKPHNEDIDDPLLTWSTFGYASGGSAENEEAVAIEQLVDVRTSSPNPPDLSELFSWEALLSAESDELVNQSWSDDDGRNTPEPTRPTSPPPLLRSNRLKKVLSQPMKQPQYEDANDTFTSSHGSQYVSCLSDEGSSSPSKQSKSAVKVEALPSPTKPIPPPMRSKQVEPRATTSRHQGIERHVDLFIHKCEDCVKNPRNLCHKNDLKSHAMYSKLMFTYNVEDKMLLALVLALSADWELVEQHLKSDGKVGAMWTQKDDRLLTNPSFRKRNLKELRKKFTSRQINTRKQFLLDRVQITPKQRKVLLGMKC